MPVVQDTFGVLQDSRAAEMCELKARVDALDERADERHAETMEAVRALDEQVNRRIDSIVEFGLLREKVAVLEAERQARQKIAL